MNDNPTKPPSSRSSRDQRRAPRIPIQRKVMIYRAGVPVGMAIARDLSTGGLFLQVQSPSVESSEHVELRVEEGGDHSRISGQIVHCSDHGLGIRFDGPHVPVLSQEETGWRGA